MREREREREIEREIERERERERDSATCKLMTNDLISHVRLFVCKVDVHIMNVAQMCL